MKNPNARPAAAAASRQCSANLTFIRDFSSQRICTNVLVLFIVQQGISVIFDLFRKAFSKTCRRDVAVQFALFAMLVQAMVPFSAAVALPGADHTARNGQDIPGFYLVICTAHGSQTSISADQPLDGGETAVMPWDCPACQAQAGVQGPLPVTPTVASTPYPPSLGCAAPIRSDRVAGLWTAAPGQPRGPPSA